MVWAEKLACETRNFIIMALLQQKPQMYACFCLIGVSINETHTSESNCVFFSHVVL